MTKFRNTLIQNDVQHTGLERELLKHYPKAKAKDFEIDNIYFNVEIESNCNIEFRNWGIKEINIYTTEVWLMMGVDDEKLKSLEWEVDLTDWEILDEHLNPKLFVGKKPNEIHFDFNRKVINVNY